MVSSLGQVGSLFTAPWLAAGGAAAVGLPVAIHLLSRLRRKHEPWGAMRFLLLAYRRHRRRLRMEQWLLLAVRCLLVLLLGLALAGPLIGGFVGDWLGGASQRGRVVHLVISDGLSTRATGSDGAARFASLKETALRLIDRLRPSDRVALWRAGRPSEPVVESATRDHVRVRSALERMEPRFGESGMADTLSRVADQLERAEVRADRGLVVVLSDFPRGADYLRQPPEPTQQRLADHARLLIERPAPGQANAQIERLTPRRGLVLASPGEPATVSVSVALRRFSRAAAPGRRQLEVTLLTRDGAALASTTRPVTWQRGQRRASVNLSLVSDQGQPAVGEGGRAWVIRARMSEAGAADALRPDDTAWATVEVRSRVNVGVVGGGEDATATPGNGDNALPPSRWLRLALAPGRGATGNVIRTTDIEPAALGTADSPLANVDAAFILRPERLDASGWAALREFAGEGGLVWVVAPPRDAAGGWVEPLKRSFGLEWRIALDAMRPSGEGPARLDPDQATPEPLSRLAADWPALLRPVRITRWLGMRVAEPQRWLTVTGNEAADGGRTVLAAADRGAGHVLVQTVPLHTGWSNLPTKPLMVPLVHETLRSLLGEGAPRGLAGERPTLGPAWAGTDRLLPGMTTGDSSASDKAEAGEAGANGASEAVALEQTGDGAQPATALNRPGIYRAAESGRALAVNVATDAGDIRDTSRQRLEGWFDRLAGERWQFLPTSDPGSALARTSERASLGWPLLWVVLALAIAELGLARYFAHARRTDQPGLHHRLADFWRHLRHSDKAARRLS